MGLPYGKRVTKNAPLVSGGMLLSHLPTATGTSIVSPSSRMGTEGEEPRTPKPTVQEEEVDPREPVST